MPRRRSSTWSSPLREPFLSLFALLADVTAVMAPVFLIAALGYGWARAQLPFDSAFVTAFMMVRLAETGGNPR